MKKSYMYYLLDTSDGPSKAFQCHTYQLPNNKNITVIYYLGDERAVSHFPHRNAKHSTVRTCPSHLKKWEQKCQVNKANVVYKKLHKHPAKPLCVPKCVEHLGPGRPGRSESCCDPEHGEQSPEVVGLEGYIPDIPFTLNTCILGLNEIWSFSSRFLARAWIETESLFFTVSSSLRLS